MRSGARRGSGSPRSSGSPTTSTAPWPTSTAPRRPRALASEADLARVHLLRGNLCFPKGDIQGCLENHGQALEIARRAGAAELEAAALGGLGDADYVRGRMISAHARFSECVAVCRAARVRPHRGRQRADGRHHPVLCPERRARGAGGHARGRRGGAPGRAPTRRDGGPHDRRRDVRQPGRARRGQDPDRRGRGSRPASRGAALRAALPELPRQGPARRRAPRRGAGLLERSLAISRETALGFSGPSVLGALALTTDDAEVRREALAEGERLLRAGSVAHNHFRFYRDAIDASLRAGEWDEAERLAAALEDFTRPEPLPWTDFYVARGRALAAWGRGTEGRCDQGQARAPRGRGPARRAAPCPAGAGGRARLGLRMSKRRQKLSQTQSFSSPNISRPAEA